MRRFLGVSAALLVAPVNAYGQVASTAARFDSVPLMWAARDRARELGVTDLSTFSPDLGVRELRLWYGFGLFGVGMVRMWEEPQGWQLCQYLAEGEILTDSTLAAKPPSVPSKLIALAWKGAVAAGLLELPPAPRRPENSGSAVDGNSWVLEWYDGERYGAAGADNPDLYKSADDQHLEQVVGHVSELWQRPLPICQRSP